MSSLDSPNLQFCYIILYVKFHLPGFKFALRPEGKRAKFHLYTVFYNRTALHSVRGCLSMWSTHNRNTCIVLDIGYFVLHFILCGNVFPCGQKYPFIHLSVLHKQHMHRHLAAEVKHIYVVFDGHLKERNMYYHIAEIILTLLEEMMV